MRAVPSWCPRLPICSDTSSEGRPVFRRRRLSNSRQPARVNTSVILFAKMATFPAAIGRGFAADVVILRLL
jgi:hypothetical protein